MQVQGSKQTNAWTTKGIIYLHLQAEQSPGTQRRKKKQQQQQQQKLSSNY